MQPAFIFPASPLPLRHGQHFSFHRLPQSRTSYTLLPLQMTTTTSPTPRRIMRFRPCIDLHNGSVKQIIGSTLTTSTTSSPQINFESEKDASYFAEMYRHDNLFGGHVIMLGPGNEEAAIRALKAYPGGLQIGGGIQPKNAEHWLNQGAMGVIVTSFCFKEGKILWENVKKMSNIVGKDKLVLDLSCRWKEDGWFVCTDYWQKWTKFRLDKENVEKLEEFCGEFLVHAVDVEGKKAGIDETLVNLLSQICNIPVTYAGGVRSLDDLDKVCKLGNGKVDVTVGSALDIFGGTLRYEDAVKWQRQKEASFLQT